eukprot:CAMPEP_0194137646 /NCGR_PEP_ID=MMETSP0152-20130528/7510_1 /TAXON_ID=1049557 /ORGANISM="Thalassiothrix antarctica, Strain L6-D1" /LENGTH=434 /DNA_ID=CAMNT_0038834753 /DNA_START=104 /DNA_END=1408 /DNA_ORIENTATION=-
MVAMVLSTPIMSDLEKRREEKIKRNEQRLRDLGLLDLKQKVTKRRKQESAEEKERKRQRISSSGLPRRRSTRERKKVSNYMEETYGDDDKDDNSVVEGDDDDVSVASTASSQISTDDEDNINTEVHDSGGSSKTRRGRKKVTKTIRRVKKDETTKEKKTSTEEYGGITIEYAKTSRSTCRKCMNKIEKGCPRVGMMAWIVGRQAQTWQMPDCFLKNVVVSYELSGRTKCKATNERFDEGELRFGTRSHTATNHYKMDAFTRIVQDIILFLSKSKMTNDDFSNVLNVKNFDGYDTLRPSDKERVGNVVTKILENHKNGKNEKDETTITTDPAPKSNEELLIKEEENVSIKEETKRKSSPPDKNKKITKVKQEQQSNPKVGTKSYSKGKVQWKFGGYTCYGTLLPQKETLTHCYARTHKGNIKTLAKGKNYWSIID